MTAALLFIAFLTGLIFRRLGYPPLLGYLLAGFLAHELEVGDISTIRQLADLGITLLLFNIGLKLNLRELAAVQVWGTATAHMLIVIVLTVPVILLISYFIPGLGMEDQKAAWLLAFALSFSSTVFAVKIFEERGESSTLHANVAIGILIIQDIFAVCFLVMTSDKLPSLWAFGLLALPLVRPILASFLERAGHGELLVLFGITVAFGAYELFELVNLKGGLGALIFGMLLGSNSKSKELYKSMISLKDLFLLGFFLQIGFYGLPSVDMLIVAAVLSALIVLRPLIYYFILIGFGLRARTSFLAGFSLFNYSEFGLIVGAIAVQAGLLSESWLTTLALAMVVSLFIATPFNTRAHEIYGRYSDLFHKFERKKRLDRDRVSLLGEADYIVLGMGRVGLGAFKTLEQRFSGDVIGVEQNLDRVNELEKQGYRCVQGDASDYDFWLDANLTKRRMLLVCLANYRENLHVIGMAKRFGYDGALAVVSHFPDHNEEFEKLGCVTFNVFAEAGSGFADHVLKELENREGSGESLAAL